MPGGAGGLAGPVNPPVSPAGSIGAEDVGTRTEIVPSGGANSDAGANGSPPAAAPGSDPVTPGDSVASSARPCGPSPRRSVVGKGGGVGVGGAIGPVVSAGNGGGGSGKGACPSGGGSCWSPAEGPVWGNGGCGASAAVVPGSGPISARAIPTSHTAGKRCGGADRSGPLKPISFLDTFPRSPGDRGGQEGHKRGTTSQRRSVARSWLSRKRGSSRATGQLAGC